MTENQQRTCYLQANCMVQPRNLVVSDPRMNRIRNNLYTFGLNRILEGRGFDLHDNFKAKLVGLDKMDAVARGTSSTVGECWTHGPREINSQDGLVWSPFPDLMIRRSPAMATDGTTYPWNPSSILLDVFGGGERIDHEQMVRDWETLFHLTRDVETKVVFLYPLSLVGRINDTLTETFRRLMEGQYEAAQRASAHGWIPMTFPTPVMSTGSNGYWFHFTAGSRQPTLDAIERYFFDAIEPRTIMEGRIDL